MRRKKKKCRLGWAKVDLFPGGTVKGWSCRRLRRAMRRYSAGLRWKSLRKSLRPGSRWYPIGRSLRWRSVEGTLAIHRQPSRGYGGIKIIDGRGAWMRHLSNSSQYYFRRTRLVEERAQTLQSHLLHALPLCGGNRLQSTSEVIRDLNRHGLPRHHSLKYQDLLASATWRNLPLLLQQI